jgi:hypothetical protein
MNKKTGQLITLVFDVPIPEYVQCRHCNEHVHPADYNGDSDECQECHDNAGYALDECGCERCVDKQVSRADFGNYND